MIATEPDFTAARSHMVDSQIRPNKVTDPRVIGALRTVARERFVPPGAVARAYADEDVPLGGGRVLMQPMVFARLLQFLLPRPGDRVLVVGGGTGYSAAVFAACGAIVTMLESDAGLQSFARTCVPSGVALVNGPLEDGWQSGAPYDIILVDGGFEVLPDALFGQLVGGTGRFGGVRRANGLCQAVLGEAIGGRMALTAVFDCATPLLGAFRRAPSFVF